MSGSGETEPSAAVIIPGYRVFYILFRAIHRRRLCHSTARTAAEEGPSLRFRSRNVVDRPFMAGSARAVPGRTASRGLNF